MPTTATRSESFHYPWRDDNRFEVLVDGSNFLPQMLAAIDTARHIVLLEMYLIESGCVVDRFVTALLAAAVRGVRIYLLLDDFGAIGLKQHDRDRLVHDNIRIVYYNRLHSHSTLMNMYRIFLLHQERSLHRNHRKLLLVDGQTAFVGGAGLVDVFDPPEHPEKQWRETMVEIQGPVVADWQELFSASWNRYASEALALPLIPAANAIGHQRGRVTVNDIERFSEVLLSLTWQITHAKERVWFATAYFVPRWRIRRSLKRAARSGVDVRLLLPGPITDHPGVRYISQRLYGRLIRNGVRIFEYQPRFFHAKTVLCDNWVAIGSSNFDRWNLRWNLEANQEVDDRDLAAQVKAIFEQDFNNSVEFSYENCRQTGWFTRLLQWFWKRVEILSQKIGR
ncbi:MAG: phosphatidylserine/phosphatidylglycerophosphate/cardiolipin synthase family protein [Gammaproteobacteria bacterium]|nr:phosphatidylserine/phosphatidylglycerophosphate/cardiolipin synthase family protein [Gammaproteobacteria bacterium]